MKRKVLYVMIAMCVVISSVNAGTVAYWRFEEGPAGAQVPNPTPGFNFYPGVADSSGNGNELGVWDEGGAGYVYRSEVGYSTVLPTNEINNYSVKNSGGGPAMFTDTADPINSITPAQWTIEATFKLENGGYKTIVGRDALGITTDGSSYNNAALYFQAVPNNGLAIKYVDVAGYFHEAVAPAGSYVGFDWGTDPDGTNAPWYSMAAVSDSETLSLYLTQHGSFEWQLIAQTDLTVSGSPDMALSNGAGGEDGADWNPGDFSVGRGLWAGGHGDRAYGYLDEIRISDSALTTSEFLVPEPATLVLLGLGALVLRRRK